MIKLLLKAPFYQLFRNIGIPQISPLALTVNVTNRCNSKCKLCKIYRKNTLELNLGEFEKIFSNFKGDIFWLTITGGEPFLREDLVEICKSAYRNFHPMMINIPTNGIFYEIIAQSVERILNECPKTHITINLSLDQFAERHDEIRGVKDSFKFAMETFKRLRAINHPNFTLGIHTVLSKYNIKDFPVFSKKLMELKPDTYIVEIAQERAELDNIGLDIQPDLRDFLEAINYFRKNIINADYKTIAKIIQSFRLRYYELIIKMLKEGRQVISCYAGFSTAYISSDGEVWACCVKAKSMGNLRDNNYNFRKIWFSKKADNIREGIKDRKCFCTAAGVNYINMLYDINSLLNSGLNFLRFSLR